MGGKGGGGSSNVPVPSASDMITAQNASNLQAAKLNNANQYGPYGSITNQYDPTTGQFTVSDAPSWAEQQLLSQQQGNQAQAGGAASNVLWQNAGAYGKPINTDYSSVRDQYINSQMGLLQPQLAQQQQQLTSQLANQGVAQGSDAWNNAMRAQNNLQAQAYANILGNATTQTGQAISQQESLLDQPITEAQQLMGLSQPQMPSQLQTSQVSPTNAMSAYQTQTSAQEFNAQQNAANNASKMGGIGSLIGTIGGAAMMGPVGAGIGGALGGSLSDEQHKTDLTKVGSLDLPGGQLPIKTFRFRGDPVRRIGFTAQDVEKLDPSSVVNLPAGKGVLYHRVLLGAHQHAIGAKA